MTNELPFYLRTLTSGPSQIKQFPQTYGRISAVFFAVIVANKLL